MNVKPVNLYIRGHEISSQLLWLCGMLLVLVVVLSRMPRFTFGSKTEYVFYSALLCMKWNNLFVELWCKDCEFNLVVFCVNVGKRNITNELL